MSNNDVPAQQTTGKRFECYLLAQPGKSRTLGSPDPLYRREVIEAANSFEARQEYAKRQNIADWQSVVAVAPAQGQTIGVKPLKWERSNGNYPGQTVWSSGDTWVFWIVKNPDTAYVWCENFNIDGFVPASPVRGSFATLDEAKTAAQADYDKRIRAALTALPASDTVWSAEVHDKIIKRLMANVGMPNSTSVYTAFKQFANELHALATAAGRSQPENAK